MTTYKRRTVLRMQRTCFGSCEHDTKVTRIGDGYNVRVLLDGSVNQESRVYDRQDVHKEIHQMLRMEAKCGNLSPMASASRLRNSRKLDQQQAD